jgi:hypothetical protein
MKLGCHALGVFAGVVQLWKVGIGVVADHQGNAGFGRFMS